jgi:hypothetical protein
MQPGDDGPQAYHKEVDAHDIAQKSRIHQDENPEDKGDDAPQEAYWLEHDGFLSFLSG